MGDTVMTALSNAESMRLLKDRVACIYIMSIVYICNVPFF